MFVMLDLDNTLADRQAAVASWAKEFCGEWSLPAHACDWILDQDRDGYANRQSVFEVIRSQFNLAAPVDRLLATYQKRVVELTALAPGALERLAALRAAGRTTAIVSNGSSGQQNAKIDALGLRDAVDVVVVSGDVGIKKPAPRIFEIAAERAGASLDGGWMVGDSAANDIIGPAQIGLKTAWLHRGRTWSDPSVEPTVTLASLTELVVD